MSMKTFQNALTRRRYNGLSRGSYQIAVTILVLAISHQLMSLERSLRLGTLSLRTTLLTRRETGTLRISRLRFYVSFYITGETEDTQICIVNMVTVCMFKDTSQSI